MANPVMNSIVKDWSTQSTTPAGYPEMPGYQPASAQAQNPYAGATNPYGTQQGVDYSGQPAYGTAQAGTEGYPVSSSYEEQMASYEAMMNAPAADAVDRGTMTYDDVVVKSLICFGLLLVGATAGWLTGIVTLGAAMLVALGACVVTLGLGLFIRFSKTVRPAAIIAYSLIEGFVLGALSFAFELMYPGIVGTAVVAALVEGHRVVQGVRSLMGATDPTTAAPGSIRGDLARDQGGEAMENLVHGSDGQASAEREIAIWFPELG